MTSVSHDDKPLLVFILSNRALVHDHLPPSELALVLCLMDPHKMNHSLANGDRDAALLASLGYKQELKRTFSRLELFGVGFSIFGVFPSIA